jgi:hypothetical protein
MATFTALRAKIKSELDAITELAFVDDIHHENITGFPAVTFDIADENSAFLTNKENLRTVAFSINIYQEIKTIGKEEAKRILDETADIVIDKFEKNFNLDGVVDWCIPLAGPRGQLETSSGAAYVQQLTLQCNFSILTI